MGWCSATEIFDDVAEVVIDNAAIPEEQRIAVLAKLYTALTDEDWDCQNDSKFYDHPIFIAAEERAEGSPRVEF